MQNWNNVNSSKEKRKTEQFRPDSVLELNTKNFGISLSFASITQATLFAKTVSELQNFEYRLSC
jgi:hypothetical protein